MDVRGLEPLVNSKGKAGVFGSGGAKSGALNHDSGPNVPRAGGNTPPLYPSEPRPSDPELAAVVDAWPRLPEAMRKAVAAMVSAAAGASEIKPSNEPEGQV